MLDLSPAWRARERDFFLMPSMAAASQFISLVVIFYITWKAMCESGICTNMLQYS